MPKFMTRIRLTGTDDPLYALSFASYGSAEKKHIRKPCPNEQDFYCGPADHRKSIVDFEPRGYGEVAVCNLCLEAAGLYSKPE